MAGRELILHASALAILAATAAACGSGPTPETTGARPDLVSEAETFVIIEADGTVTPTARSELSAGMHADTPGTTWTIQNGRTLRWHLEDWSKRADWTLQYQTTRDWPIGAAASTTGSFLEAINRLAQGLSQARPSPIFRAYRGNRVLVIADDGTPDY